MADDAQIVLRAYTAQLDTDLKQATGSVQKFADSMRSSLTSAGTQWKTIPIAANEVDKSLGGLMGTLKDFKADQVQQARSARFFANELASIVPMSGAASGALQGLLSAGLELGGGLTKVAAGFAVFELVKVGVGFATEAWRAHAEEVRKAGEELSKVADGVIKKTTERVAGLRMELNALRNGNNPLKETATDLAAAQLALNKALQLAKKEGEALPSLDTIRGLLKGSPGELSDFIGDNPARKAVVDAVRAVEAARDAMREIRGLSIDIGNEKGQQEADAKALKDKEEAAGRALTAVEKERLAWDQLAARMAQAMVAGANANVGGLNTSGPSNSPDFAGSSAFNAQPDIKAGVKAAEERRKMMQADGQVYVQLASQLGDVFGRIATSQMSIIAGIKQMISGMVQVVAQAMIELELAIAVAAAKAAGSVSIIPFVGPALGIAAAAAMFSALMAYTPSAATGWDKLPSDQLVRAHKGERILTAYDTERMDRLEAGAGGGPTVINVGFIDVRGAEDFLDRNRVGLVRTLTKAAKDGVRG